MKKRRKPRPKKTQTAISASDAKAIPQPPREEVRRPLVAAITFIAKIAAPAAAIVGLPLAIFHWWPQISVEPSAAADLVSNPLSSYFKITNEQVIPIRRPERRGEPSVREDGSRQRHFAYGQMPAVDALIAATLDEAHARCIRVQPLPAPALPHLVHPRLDLLVGHHRVGVLRAVLAHELRYCPILPPALFPMSSPRLARSAGFAFGGGGPASGSLPMTALMSSSFFPVIGPSQCCGGSTVMMSLEDERSSMSRHRDDVQRLPSLSCPAVIRCH